MCFLTNYPIAVPIPNKSTETFIQAYLQHVYAIFGSALTCVTDSVMEFLKNELYQTVAEELGIKHQYSSPHHPQSNGILKKNDSFLKSLY